MRMVSVIAGWAMVMSGAAWAAPAQAPRFVALDTMQHGLWQFREVGEAPRAMCVRDPVTLFQLRNRGAQCTRFVIENSPTVSTVHLTCPGRGHSRTTITVQTPRLVHIETEGIEGGAPFSHDIQARRTGDCPA